MRAGAKLCAAAVGCISDGFHALTGRKNASAACGLKPRSAVRLTVFRSTRGRTPVPVPADRKDTAAISPLRRAHGVRLRRGQREADGAARGPRRAVHQSCGTRDPFQHKKKTLRPVHRRVFLYKRTSRQELTRPAVNRRAGWQGPHHIAAAQFLPETFHRQNRRQLSAENDPLPDSV